MKDRPGLGTEFPGYIDVDVWKMTTLYRASYFKAAISSLEGGRLNCWDKPFEITSVRRVDDWRLDLNQKSDLYHQESKLNFSYIHDKFHKICQNITSLAFLPHLIM